MTFFKMVEVGNKNAMFAYSLKASELTLTDSLSRSWQSLCFMHPRNSNNKNIEVLSVQLQISSFMSSWTQIKHTESRLSDYASLN